MPNAPSNRRKQVRPSSGAKLPSYAVLLTGFRRRPSRVSGRTLEEEADADRGRVLFCAPFRRLQNKAQVFSLETNASVRSRLTHSLEVSSIGRYVAIQAIDAFKKSELESLGVAGNERALITFVETACLLHDIGNPPFGHFGEIAISDWFHVNEGKLKPAGLGPEVLSEWQQYYNDFQHFDGNPQGFRLVSRLQASQTRDLFGLNLTATTLAATVKYPWSPQLVGTDYLGRKRKKAGYFKTEADVVKDLWAVLGLETGRRHPLAFLMEAADDIAYCLSDIEDGIEKGLVNAREFAEYMLPTVPQMRNGSTNDAREDAAVDDLESALRLMSSQHDEKGVEIVRLTPIHDFRSGALRYLTRKAGQNFHRLHDEILAGNARSLLQHEPTPPLLRALNDFAVKTLYSSRIVRQRELTAHAVLTGLLDAYLSLMQCDRSRFSAALDGNSTDDNGRKIARECSLAGRISKRYLAVYDEAVRLSDAAHHEVGLKTAMERIYRIRLIVDYVTGMTDEFALQTHQLIAGLHVNPYSN